MTITEQLQFSVLTTPVATLDRRTLSQAWYSALYGSDAHPERAAGKTPIAAAGAAHTASEPAGSAHSDVSADRSPVLRSSAGTSGRTDGVAPERRAPRSTLARKIERAFLRPRSASHKSAFTIDADEGRVHVVLHTRGTQLKLVAICSPKARPQVAAALAQARYALALRGIDLDAETRGATAC